MGKCMRNRYLQRLEILRMSNMDHKICMLPNLRGGQYGPQPGPNLLGLGPQFRKPTPMRPTETLSSLTTALDKQPKMQIQKPKDLTPYNLNSYIYTLN